MDRRGGFINEKALEKVTVNVESKVHFDLFLYHHAMFVCVSSDSVKCGFFGLLELVRVCFFRGG